jgi:hypothetical protein
MCPRYLFSNERLPVPDDPAGVQFILQDAVHPLPAAADSRRVPRAPPRGPAIPFLFSATAMSRGDLAAR